MRSQESVKRFLTGARNDIIGSDNLRGKVYLSIRFSGMSSIIPGPGRRIEPSGVWPDARTSVQARFVRKARGPAPAWGGNVFGICSRLRCRAREAANRRAPGRQAQYKPYAQKDDPLLANR